MKFISITNIEDLYMKKDGVYDDNNSFTEKLNDFYNEIEANRKIPRSLKSFLHRLEDAGYSDLYSRWIINNREKDEKAIVETLRCISHIKSNLLYLKERI